MLKTVFLVTDGASRGNPGPSAIGFGIYDEHWTPLEERAENIGVSTNNEAEYKALIQGLHACTAHSREEVKHFTDSKLVAKQSSGEWTVRAPNLKRLAEEISAKKLQFARVIHVYVSRTDPRIQRIDALVNEKLKPFV